MTFLSKIGKNMILPQDVLIQSKETNSVSGAINATIGMATKNGKVMKLPSLEKIIHNLSAEDYLGYAPTPGENSIRELWKQKIITQNNNINPSYLSDPVATTGITQSIDVVATLFSEEGDAILLPDLFWQNYAQIFNIKLGNNIYKYKQFENGYFNLNGFKETLNTINEQKISILLNFPNNPTGYTPSVEEFSELEKILADFAKNNKEKNIILLCDDAYFGLFFEKNHKNSTLNCLAKLVEYDNILLAKLDGITKELYAWGLRVGFVTYYTKDNNFRKTITEKTQGFLRSATSSGSNLAQKAIKILLSNDSYLKEKIANDQIIENRYITLKKIISDEKIHEIVEILPFNSGYFFTIKLPKHINAHDFRLKLLHDYKYGVYSMDDEHIRIAFSCLENEQIISLMKNIKKCLI